jgi:MinD-like ATPase involved in chromosome partitioning or flagellar assembly
MISFGEVFNKIQESFKADAIKELVSSSKSVTVIRDVNGRVRFLIEPNESEEYKGSDITTLKEILSKNLGDYFGNDIWLPTGTKDPYQALIKVITDERVSADWDNADAIPRWYVLERHIAKQTWTDKLAVNPPWPEEFVYKNKKPAIVSFFSFKGGVGRTSSLVATALTLARSGLQVAIVDLDLEAPGLASIFTSGDSSDSGVIDYLLEKQIHPKEWKIRSQLIPISARVLLGDDGQNIQLLPAGTVDNNYLEKLARLDFQNLASNELQNIMKDMLKELQSAVNNLDFILIDARAGFHDLGGLAIANLAHGVVIFGTQSRQSWAGLSRVVSHLATPEIEQRLPLILVHAMAPSVGLPGREKELQEFREIAYDLFRYNYYAEDETVPDSTNKEEPFFPIVAPYQEYLRGDLALFPRQNTSEETDRLSELVRVMTNDSPYRKIAEKLCEKFARQFSY